MKKHRVALGMVVIMVAFALSTSLAYAQATRTWVSGVGDDVNPCSRTAPCKTFAGAISKTAVGGVISVLDPGGFGAVTITKAITIDASGMYGGVLASGTNGIIVSAGTNDAVVLRGLSIEGMGTGINGIYFLAGASLTVENCTISGFSNMGIDFEPTTPSRLFVRDTITRNMGWGGILIKPANSTMTKASIDRVRTERGLVGIRSEDFAFVSVNDSTMTGNQNNGVLAYSAANGTEINVQRSVVTGNGNGVGVYGPNAVIRLADTVVTDNTNGLAFLTGGAFIFSFGNNVIEGNVTDGSPSAVHPLR